MQQTKRQHKSKAMVRVLSDTDIWNTRTYSLLLETIRIEFPFLFTFESDNCELEFESSTNELKGQVL